MLKAHLFDVPILDREFKVMIAPEPLDHRVEVDIDEAVIEVHRGHVVGVVGDLRRIDRAEDLHGVHRHQSAGRGRSGAEPQISGDREFRNVPSRSLPVRSPIGISLTGRRPYAPPDLALGWRREPDQVELRIAGVRHGGADTAARAEPRSCQGPVRHRPNRQRQHRYGAHHRFDP